jgi:hypothetical protein
MQCRAVLLLVHELHLRGFQRLRAIPGMAPSGKFWWCAITPVSLVSVNHGARLVDGAWNDPRIARYSSRDQNRYFQWTDISPHTTPSGLARRFEQRFPNVVEAGRGSDWLYAGWYVEMLHLTYPDQFPYAMANVEVSDTHLPIASPGQRRLKFQIPLPPPGEAVAYREPRPGQGELAHLASPDVRRTRTRPRLAG